MKKVFCTIPLLAIIIGLLWPVTIQAATAHRVLTIIAPDGQKLDRGTVFTPKQRLAVPLRQFAQANPRSSECEQQ
ncbi:hypothetical protein [Paenibacillus wenxiniae]|uniref:Copper amine oxidase N-terminal domain-containing protein n=1 Tax=Paenibacillus wenxiniae TaxID=1636843 RepID=A0ABW4RKK6_9BACL